MAKVDEAHYEREMKTYTPPKGEAKRIPMHPRGLLRSFSCFVLSIAQKSKESILACPLVMLQRSWNRCEITLLQVTSSFVKKKAASKLKEKHEKDIAA